MTWKKTGVLYVKYDEQLIESGFRLKHAKLGDVGFDLPVVLDERLKIEPHQDYYINRDEGWFDIPPRGQAEIPCGMAIKVPEDAWANIKPRSSTPWRRKLFVNEAVIDSGYTGPLFILVNNPNNIPIKVRHGERLAQLILSKKYEAEIDSVEELPSTDRGATGFGSSGGHKESSDSNPLDRLKV